jgi:hypothetical protein
MFDVSAPLFFTELLSEGLMNLQIQRLGERKLLGRIGEQQGVLHLVNIPCGIQCNALNKPSMNPTI